MTGIDHATAERTRGRPCQDHIEIGPATHERDDRRLGALSCCRNLLEPVTLPAVDESASCRPTPRQRRSRAGRHRWGRAGAWVGRGRSCRRSGCPGCRRSRSAGVIRSAGSGEVGDACDRPGHHAHCADHLADRYEPLGSFVLEEAIQMPKDPPRVRLGRAGCGWSNGIAGVRRVVLGQERIGFISTASTDPTPHWLDSLR